MKEITTLILALFALYLLLTLGLYLFQRSMIYYPVAPDPGFAATEISVDSDGVRLHGWVLNPGHDKAVVYFGGNSEQISWNRETFEDVFRDYSVYLINYRGYGYSEGKPSEAALFADAVAIYDQLAPRHGEISALGRSLGSGVALYLATQRPLARLILLTPYDSVTAVARRAYPVFPVNWLLRDRFDSAARAAQVEVPVLIVAAERDRVVPPEHARALQRELVNARVSFVMIRGAAHNDVSDYPEYREALRAFIEN